MWDYESLYSKSREFVRKGLEHQDPSSAEVPLWCILALEFLARATLSRQNPALLVDLRIEESLLSICGISTKKTPTSAPASVIFSRCMFIFHDFTEAEYKKCLVWLNWRNEELHTGKSPFDSMRSAEWRPDFYRIYAVFLSHNGATLEDFIGKPLADAANTIIDSLNDQKKKEAHDRVRDARENFEELEVEERADSLKSGSAKAKAVSSANKRCSDRKCPSCGGRAVLVSDLIRSTTPTEWGGELVQDDEWLPVGLVCYCCDLKLAEHAHVSAVGFGDQYITKDILDPIDYFEIDPREPLMHMAPVARVCHQMLRLRLGRGNG